MVMSFAYVPLNLHAQGGDIFEIEKAAILQRIRFEKVRIANDYQNANKQFLNLIDSVANYTQTIDIPKQKRNQYLLRLQVFLTNVNRYYSENYLRNGTYLAQLSYFPVMIEWDVKDELQRNLKRYANFSARAVRLIPNDTVAEEFMTDYLKDYPDEVFRLAEEFDDRKFALRLLERAMKLAPESAKRYFTTANPVNNILSRSSDPYVRKSYMIYDEFGIKSRAYLLLDAIVRNNMGIGYADSMGNNPDRMFTLLVTLSMQYDANVSYSIYRYLDQYSNDYMRKFNQQVLEGSQSFDQLRKKSPEEMFVLLGYGYAQVSPATLSTLMDMLKEKMLANEVNQVIISSMDKEKLKQLTIYCDEQKLLSKLFALVNDEKRAYLLALTSIEVRTDLFPPFKIFSKDYGITLSEPQDKTLTEITKARPPKPIVYEEVDEEKPVRPEKPLATETKAPEPVKKPEHAVPVLVEKTQPATMQKKDTAMPVLAKADVVPIPVEDVVKPIRITVDERTRNIIALKKNILNTIRNIPSFLQTDYAEEILLYAAQREPDELLKKTDAFKSKPFALKVLEVCAFNAPVSVKRYLYNPNHPVNAILQYSKKAHVLKLFEVNPQLGYQSKPLLLMDDIIHNRIHLRDAMAISGDSRRLFKAITQIVARENFVGRYSINHEMRDYSLRFIREINDKIASGAPQPFYSVDEFGSTELYFLMLFGRDELFNASYNGLFNRFILKMPGGDAEGFMKSINMNRYRDYMSLCASFGVLEEFLSKFNYIQRQKLLNDYVSGLENERDDISSIVLVAEAITNLSDHHTLTSVQTRIKSEYERISKTNDVIGLSIYGVLSSIISGNARTDAGWYRSVSKQFQVTPANSLPLSALFTENNICVGQMYFYNDDDGRSSYINFLSQYKTNGNWVIDDRGNYVRVYSVSGKQVEIFANKPEFQENGIQAINEYFKLRNLRPTVVVHRGHSFHTESTLERVPPSTRLLFVGSCGGFYKISIALESAPHAHVISTKQIGTKTVNDAMLFAINERIREGKDLDWNEFWDKMRERLGSNQYFKDYIPPHKNLESIFITAYYKILGV